MKGEGPVYVLFLAGITDVLVKSVDVDKSKLLFSVSSFARYIRCKNWTDWHTAIVESSFQEEL